MRHPPESPTKPLTDDDSSDNALSVPSSPGWRRSTKPLIGIGLFAVLSTGILFVTRMFGGMGGHDMGGMSHDDMMRVDGAFNAMPVTVEEVQPAPLDASVNYTGAIYPYSEVTVYPRVAGQLSNYDIYPGDQRQCRTTARQLRSHRTNCPNQ